ncbi:cytochrome P450 [Legionella sp. D16C41]|uniref:cytochrome P450 n=1 Tax=Legionella sp. D16C41 TaxID=3402688 RepID=UPI003AF801AD
MFSLNNGVTFFAESDLTGKIKNTLNWLYEHAPVNFSSLTGWYHPTITRLSGNPFFGRAGYATQNDGVGLGEELNNMAKSASLDLRKMCYGSLGNRPFLFVTRPSDIKQIMVTHQHDVDRNEALEPFTFIFGDKNIFGLPSDENWRRKRAELKRWIFTTSALDELMDKMNDIIDEYIARLMLSGVTPSLETFMTTLAMDLFSRSVLNTESLFTEAPAISNAFGNAMKTACNPASCFILALKKIAENVNIKLNTRLDDNKKNVDQVVSDLFVKPNIRNLIRQDNFLRHYFSKISEDILTCDDTALVEEAVTNSLQDASSILLAGHETTSRLLQFTIMLLAKHPEILADLRIEIDKNRPSNGVWTRPDLERMTYLHKILKESLRLYPPVPVIPRVVTNEFYLANLDDIYHSKEEYQHLMAKRDTSKDLRLSAGTVIFIAVWQAHRLDTVYDNPNNFHPKRFNSSRVTDTFEEPEYEGAYLPFGLGMRDCIGRKVAIQEALLSVLLLVDNFDITIQGDLSPNHTYMQGTLKHKDKIAVEFKKRNVDFTYQLDKV